MALQTQIVKLVEKLTDLTSQNKIAWETTADEDTFLTSAGKSVVAVSRGIGPDEGADYRIQLLNDAGRLVEETTVSIVDRAQNRFTNDLDLHLDWQKVRSLYELARRSALHADQAVAELLSSLEQIR
jgi:hypothetical protein